MSRHTKIVATLGPASSEPALLPVSSDDAQSTATSAANAGRRYMLIPPVLSTCAPACCATRSVPGACPSAVARSSVIPRFDVL